MQISFSIEDGILEDAKRFTGISDDETLFKEALTALTQKIAARKLAARGGTDPGLKPIPRRRPAA